jgi:ATP-binding protein involved in chromosome partitioning
MLRVLPQNRSVIRRTLYTSARLFSHENPLGLPRNNAPPTMPRRSGGPPRPRSIPNVKSVIVVSSAKGGVGKSTVAGECIAWIQEIV